MATIIITVFLRAIKVKGKDEYCRAYKVDRKELKRVGRFNSEGVLKLAAYTGLIFSRFNATLGTFEILDLFRVLM